MNLINEKKISEESKKYLRIGGKWFKKAKDPINLEEKRYPITPGMIIADEGKEIGAKILAAAPKYLASTNLPSHTNFQESIMNPDGEMFFNEYHPIRHTPVEGSWQHIEKLLRHLFSGEDGEEDQYEIILDYFQLLYLKPMQKLPVILLTSRAQHTGKSTFCNFVKAIYGQNVMAIDKARLTSQFNSAWLTKLVVFIEETQDMTTADIEKIKTLVTALTTPSEAKGKDAIEASTIVKVILCTNNEANPVAIDETDTRFWVRKVHPLAEDCPKQSFLEDCEKEIPAFLYFLLHRKMSTNQKDRLWFSSNQIRTKAWQKIVCYNEPKLDAELREALIDIMNQTGEDTLMYDAVSLANLCNNLGISNGRRGNIGRTDIKSVLSKWGLHASKNTVRFRFKWQYGAEYAIDEKEKTGKAYTITRKIIEQNSINEQDF